MIQRAGVYWVDLGDQVGSRPAKERPVLIVQSEPYNASKLATALAVAMTSNTSLAAMPGNVFVPAVASGLPKDSVVNVTAVVTVDKHDLTGPVGVLPTELVKQVDQGLRQVLGLS
ncbi:type II toxin-antitoxin system PemK/MazF family toxin [Haloechinothrix aidingensis]|uniref:type II toxin-antitoxin system PemK/MazF family toxin n=1 Tax=Haloechinothrix aidingensis TaxID=2752311 RepID=UPI0031B5C5F6